MTKPKRPEDLKRGRPRSIRLIRIQSLATGEVSVIDKDKPEVVAKLEEWLDGEGNGDQKPRKD